jgi:hypothetical protein
MARVREWFVVGLASSRPSAASIPLLVARALTRCEQWMPPTERRATISTHTTRQTQTGLETPKHPEAVHASRIPQPALAHPRYTLTSTP